LEEGGYVFEPFSISSEIRTFLSAISDGISDYGEISISLIRQLVPWDESRISSLLEILITNRICIHNKTEQVVFFPGFKK
jgi:hypothetical protein